MKKRDIILIASLIIISAASLIPVWARARGRYACIYVRGSEYGRYDLSEDALIRIDDQKGLVNEIEISGGSVRMKSATCPGRQCMSCGSISRSNESICCAPAGILVIIPSEEGSEYDAITQ